MHIIRILVFFHCALPILTICFVKQSLNSLVRTLEEGVCFLHSENMLLDKIKNTLTNILLTIISRKFQQSLTECLATHKLCNKFFRIFCSISCVNIILTC